MKILARSALFLPVIFSVLAAAAVGQVSTPAPTPTPVDNDVVKISTNLIRVDVTVTDSKGKAISDLRPEEIEIYENGQKQKITGLTYVSGGVRTAASKPDAANKNAVPVPTTTLRADQIRRTIALVVDDLTLSFESTYQTRRALKKYVDEQMQDGDLVAIIRTGAGIGALQQFTSDKRVLYAAIDKVKWNALGNGGISAFAPLLSKQPIDEDNEEPEAGNRSADGVEREFNDFRESYFATGTLGALEYVIRGMGELPGRKSVVLFSDGFALSNINAEGFTENSPVLDPIRRLIEQANRASVVVYAMDPRGLVYTGLTAADDTGGRTSAEVDSDLATRRAKLSETQQSLRYISEETGGFALINNNDLIGGVRRVVEDQSYYLVAYEPDDDTFDPLKRRFNKLDVKVLRSGASVRYRSGFFNVVDREKPASTSTAGSVGQLEYALISPFAVNGIDLRLNALFGNDAKNVSFVRSLLHVDASDIKFVDAPNGDKKAIFEIVAMSFGDNGQPVDQLGKSYTLTVRQDVYPRVAKEGFVYQFIFPVKKAGPYQYRVAIKDTIGGKIGSASQFIDVPELKKNRLTLSSVILENLSLDAWKRLNDPAGGSVASNPMSDTALRRIKTGSILRYGFEIYNARLNSANQPSLQSRIRVFRDSKLVLDGAPVAVDLSRQTDMHHLRWAGAISIGDKMTPGDYILQIIVTDTTGKAKEQIATQAVQFEIVE